MARYKITKVYVVVAQTKAEALQLVREGKAEERLEYESAKELAVGEGCGWFATAKRQVAGK